MEKLYNYFENLYKENKMSQAFLIGNVVYDEIKCTLLDIFKKFIFNKDNINIENCPDIYVLKPEDGIISRDEIRNLLKKISTTSQFNSKKVYVIDKCEELSDSTYNALLKTIEEPQSGVFAFLITNNIDSVKPTIVSRCQKIFISSSSELFDINMKYNEIALDLINRIEKEKIKTIANYYKIYNIISDRKTFLEVLKNMLMEYENSLKLLMNDDKDTNIIIENNDILNISKKILLINDTITKLNNYLNKNISLDRFIIEMWRCSV